MRPLSFLKTRELATWVNESIEKLADNYGNEHFYKNPEKSRLKPSLHLVLLNLSK